MHHARGELLISLRDSVLAEQSLQRAIAVARSQTAKLYEVRATSLALRRNGCFGSKAAVRGSLRELPEYLG
jgi:hypothetical protein